MSDQSNLINYIIVLGTTKSGSGSVFDYLAGRGDLRNPLQGQEYHLPQMPNGLMTLEAISKSAFHPGTSDFVLSEFEKITKILFRPKTRWQFGMNYELAIPSFQMEIEKFINEICAANFPMRLHWRRLMQSNSPIKYFIIALRNRLGFNEKVFNTRLLVSQDDLVLAAQKFHNRLFQVNSDKRPILLNQSGSGWNPVDSTKYFLNRKIVLLTRDPRDQFAELKIIKQARSVEGFIDWYKELQKRLEKINNTDVLHLRFEEFVNNNEEMVNVLCTHMSLDQNILSNYDPNLSKKNIGKYKEFLSHKEIDVIQKDLSKYID